MMSNMIYCYWTDAQVYDWSCCNDIMSIDDIYLDHLKHEKPPILNFSELVEMPIDISRISIRDQDRLVSSVPGPSLL